MKVCIQVCIVFALILGLWSPLSHAAPQANAYVLVENKHPDKVSDSIMNGIGVSLFLINMSQSYKAIFWSVGERATVVDFKSKMKLADRMGLPFDLYVLTHGLPGRISLREDYIYRGDIRSLGYLPSFRFVYMMNCYGDMISNVFMEIGAKTTLARAVTGLDSDGINFPYDYPFFLSAFKIQTQQQYVTKKVGGRWVTTLETVEWTRTVDEAHIRSMNVLHGLAAILSRERILSFLLSLIPEQLVSTNGITLSPEEIEQARKVRRGAPATRVNSPL